MAKDTQPVELTGRNVEETTVFNAVAITDTAFKSSTTLNLSKYKSVSFMILTSLDQPVSIYNQVGNGVITPSSAKVFDGTAFVEKIISIPVGAFRYILNPKDIFNNDFTIPPKVILLSKCAIAPTTGSLTVVMIGVIN